MTQASLEASLVLLGFFDPWPELVPEAADPDSESDELE